MDCLLLVEDDPSILTLLQQRLRDYKILAASTHAQARKWLAQETVDLIVLDVHVPDGNGFDFCASLKADPRTETIPVIFLTAQGDTSDKVMGFSLGAEDYLTKPFDSAELKVRIAARLRSRAAQVTRDALFRWQDLSLDLARQTASWAQTPIDLSRVEFKMLHFFARHDGHVLSRDQLIREVWGVTAALDDRTVDSHVSHLRKKLAGLPCSVDSVYGQGYRFTRKR